MFNVNLFQRYHKEYLILDHCMKIFKQIYKLKSNKRNQLKFSLFHSKIDQLVQEQRYNQRKAKIS